MCTSLLWLRRYGAVITLLGLTASICARLEAQFDGSIYAGERIFTREFEPNLDSDLPGDGLGPVFNATSCVACHHQGGIGGAGDNRFNVHILSVMPPKRTLSREARTRFQNQLQEIHPEFENTGSILLHRQGIRPAYDRWRERLLGLQFDDPQREMSAGTRRRRLERLNSQGTVVRLPKYRGIEFMVTQRNSTSLMGANLIDSIPDQVLLDMAAHQAESNDGIAGRVSDLGFDETGVPLVGKFGWRGQVATLEEFVRGACVAEMGLQLNDQAQPLDPTRKSAARPQAKSAPPESEPELPQDIDETELRNLVRFARSLSAPAQQVPTDPDRLTEALVGGAHFRSVGCATCHVPRLGQVKGIFSDLLLHDMGQSLEDPLPTPGIEASLRIGTGRFRSSGWLGGRREIFVQEPNLPAFRSWRTPPLWGVAKTAPYMHDGRADTLHEAILCHDGEGLASAQRYRKLAKRDRQYLVAYLQAIGHGNE